MDEKLFSKTLPIYSGTIENLALQDSLAFLKNVLTTIDVLQWSETRIAVPLTVKVDLPTLGNKDIIDIRSIEPIILVFDLYEYPAVAPRVFTDRIDFPKDKLAHLYIAVNGRPPAFCYVRGNSDEWYANKRLEDLLTRISNWLRDAATGELTENGQQFEPLRLEGYSGTIVYDYDLFADIVVKKKALFPGQNFAIILFERLKENEFSSYKFVKFLTKENALKVIEEVDEERKKGKNAIDRKNYYYGYLLWAAGNETYEDYQIDLPKDWEEFKRFCDLYKINYTDFEKIVAAGDGNYYIHFPVILGLKRPSELIGFSSNMEFVNFRFTVDTTDVSDEKIINNIPVKIQIHNQPLTMAKARLISGESQPMASRNVIFGCGALGSKVIMHMARSGHTNLSLIDPDTLSPHNLARHALFADDEGENKAFALAEKIKKMYPFEAVGIANGVSFKEGIFEKSDTFDKYDWALDFTASEAFFNKLAVARNMDKLKIASGSISDFGNLGILLKEGENRNPRIDDLQTYLYSFYKYDKKTKDWLQREQLANTGGNLIVQVGVGCNSETTILSDHKVSSHGSYFAGVLKRKMDGSDYKGKIFLNRVEDEGDFGVETLSIEVDPFDVMEAKNDSTWSIRFKNGILEQIKQISRKSKNRETGGVFIGMANYKTKTIHVTDLLDAPPDSRGDSICFYRGHEGLPELIRDISEGSGGQLGYIGEWHSHPSGPNGLSDVDMASVSKFKTEFSNLITPLPVFLTVVAPVGILPFVF